MSISRKQQKILNRLHLIFIKQYDPLFTFLILELIPERTIFKYKYIFHNKQLCFIFKKLSYIVQIMYIQGCVKLKRGN